MMRQTFQAVGELAGSIATARGVASLTIPEEVIEDTEDRKVVARYTPLGVVAGIVPWNFPNLLAMIKMYVVIKLCLS